MKFTVPVALALAGAILAQNTTFTTSTSAAYPSTTTVSALTTVCGAATVLTQNGNYYTCTEAMTLTITDCPCTMTHVRPFTFPLSFPRSSPLPLSALNILKSKLTHSQPSYMTYAATPTTTAASTSIIVPALCPTTIAASTLAQNALYATSCAAGAAGYTPSSLGAVMGTTMLPSSTRGYLYTSSAGVRFADAGKVVALVGFGALCALLI
jgi:hypothetical protein